MRLFYHHVGKIGSKEDFKKTVFTKVPLSILETISGSNPHRADIIETVSSLFPQGTFNCWGVPSGADLVIKQLEAGDAVLLVETTGEFGSIPVLCVVKAFWKEQLRELSQAVWGESKYPYVFFFTTEVIGLTWREFADDLAFKPNFDPRGRFYSIADERLERFGGVAGYLDHIRARKDEISRVRVEAKADL